MKLEMNYFQKSPRALSEFITMYNMVREITEGINDEVANEWWEEVGKAQ